MYQVRYSVKESEKNMNQDELLRILEMVTDEVKRNGKNAIYTKIMIEKEC